MRPYWAETVQTPYGEATSFTYDGAGRLVRQVNGDSTVRTLAYDGASQTTDLYDYTSVSQVAHFHYDYTPAGQVARMTQNSAQTTTYTYDGADQLVSEVHAGDSVAYSLGFSYDHNGNRLTQTRGGSVVQSFAYDAHDKLLSGNASGETYSYDGNGNQTGLNYYGSFYTFTWDDEDRLTGVTNPGGAHGLNDSFLYNGLGQRTAKNDSTGQYALVSDGAAPAAPVLADGVTVYTPGLSSRKNGYSEFRHGDLLGSLRFLTDANQNVVGDRLFSAFGATVASDGDPSTPFGWVGDGESQTDADTGLVLMGHRVYDSRLGRFLSQDPAGAGGNWYAYCGNNPVDKSDPSGLSPSPNPSGAWSVNGSTESDAAWATAESGMMEAQADQFMGAVRSQMAQRQKASRRHYHERLNTPGTLWNNSSFSTPFMFDREVGKKKVFYEMFLPPHTYTAGEDVDFVFWANDPKSAGGYDWRHIWGLTNCIITDAGKGNIDIPGIYRDGVFHGYPYNVLPLPGPGNVSLDIETIATNPTIQPALIGPIP